MATPDPTTLFTRALQQTQDASAQVLAQAVARDQELAAVRVELATITAERDRLRAELDAARKLDEVRSRMVQNAEEALAAERRVFDERTRALRDAEKELRGEVREGDAAGGTYVGIKREDKEELPDPNPTKRRRVSDSSQNHPTTPVMARRSMNEVIRAVKFKRKPRPSSPPSGLDFPGLESLS
ncbi:hypothetical protein C8R43DRAFT_1239382 [Mycena crocata]|nr:hypothetical protein C8R43DRAFT_1239382 [Mycena crocata]